MELPPIEMLSTGLLWTLIGCVVAFLWAPLLTHILYKYNITVGRRGQFDVTLGMGARNEKNSTPVMGGLLIILTVAVLTFAFNWERTFTWVPIGVMLLSAGLGAFDDLLNIFGSRRRSRTLKQTLKLISVHKHIHTRIWLILTLPWTMFKRIGTFFGSHPGKGIHVHEKLLLQFAAGAITAWWIFYKLGESWRVINIPFDGTLNIGWLLVPLIVLVVMFTANAVNIADGLDGLAGGMLIPTFGALLFLSWTSDIRELAILNGTTMGALITYTYFNIKPARFQMGDVGSLGLGALLAINALALNLMMVLPFLAFMFYVEAVSVLLQLSTKFITGRRLFRMAPIHHHFEMLGWAEEKIVMRFWMIHIFFVLIGVWLALH